MRFVILLISKLCLFNSYQTPTSFQGNLHTPIIIFNFIPTFGGAFKAEITPFEPDPGNTGEGKKS